MQLEANTTVYIALIRKVRFGCSAAMLIVPLLTSCSALTRDCCAMRSVTGFLQGHL